MRQLFIPIILSLLIVSSCQKSSADITKPKATTDPVVTTPPPTASFRITNAASCGDVWEGLNLTIVNFSENADSYLWDFGNGVTSTDKAPANVSLFPCGMTYTITLTVKNESGKSVTYSAPYFILCSRGMGFGTHVDKH